MIFKRKESFFLDLSGGDSASPEAAKASQPVQVAVKAPAAPKAAAAAQAATKTAEPTVAGPAGGAAPATAAAKAEAAGPAKPMLTTAEAIAAELRAAQEARPAPSSATFAPDCLNPANAVPQPRRKAGANLAGFKAMAAEMFRS